jgi:hypothetical protein
MQLVRPIELSSNGMCVGSEKCKTKQVRRDVRTGWQITPGGWLTQAAYEEVPKKEHYGLAYRRGVL